jgi:transposase
VQGRAASFKKLNFERLLQSTIIVACKNRLIAKRPQIAGDSTGFEVGLTSFYYRSHRGKRRFHTPRWPKLTACVDIDSHLFVSTNVDLGPSRDTLQAAAVLRKAHRRVQFRRVLWDGGCDSERFHEFVRGELKAHSVVPIKSGRKTRRWPKTKFRRQMRKRFFKRIYGQRWQIESTFSRHKRRLHSALRAKTWSAQQAEVYLRVVVHNLMILRRIIEAFQQSNGSS